MGPGGPRLVPPGTGWGGVPDSPCICRVGVWRRVRWMWRRWWQVVRVKWLSRVGMGLGGPFGVNVVARHTVLGKTGAAPGGRRGSGLERLLGGAAIPCAVAVRARGVVARWGRVVGSGWL